MCGAGGVAAQGSVGNRLAEGASEAVRTPDLGLNQQGPALMSQRSSNGHRARSLMKKPKREPSGAAGGGEREARPSKLVSRARVRGSVLYLVLLGNPWLQLGSDDSAMIRHNVSRGISALS